MTKEREQELLKKIEQLERDIAELKARPPVQYHYWYQQQPYYVPPPTIAPFPQPYYPTITWGAGSAVIGQAVG